MTGIAHVPYLEHRKPGFLYRRRIPARLLHPSCQRLCQSTEENVVCGVLLL